MLVSLQTEGKDDPTRGKYKQHMHKGLYLTPKHINIIKVDVFHPEVFIEYVG
jgi:hypothetical protein